MNVPLIVVEATAPLLQRATAEISDVISNQQVVQLPINGRNPLTLLVLEPGVIQRSSGGAGSGIHVNGSRDRAYNVTIDGIPFGDGNDFNHHTTSYFPAKLLGRVTVDRGPGTASTIGTLPMSASGAKSRCAS